MNLDFNRHYIEKVDSDFLKKRSRYLKFISITKSQIGIISKLFKNKFYQGEAKDFKEIIKSFPDTNGYVLIEESVLIKSFIISTDSSGEGRCHSYRYQLGKPLLLGFKDNIHPNLKNNNIEIFRLDPLETFSKESLKSKMKKTF